MGYRSEVRIATTRKDYDMICERVDALSEERDTYQLVGTKREPEFFEEESGCVVFGWDWIKWYDGALPDVTNVTRALAEIGEREIPYEFCRVGEEYDDIEFESCNDNETLALHVYPDVTIGILS